MKETIRATYERESTLWKNANYFYVLQDWVRMDCVVRDYSEDRADIKEMGMHWIDMDGNDVTEKVLAERYYDCYAIVLTNKRKNNTRVFKFRLDEKDEANSLVRAILNHKVLTGWKKVISETGK